MHNSVQVDAGDSAMLHIHPRFRRSNRKGQQFIGMALLVSLLAGAIVWAATLVVESRNQRNEDRRADAAASSQFVRAEHGVFGAAANGTILIAQGERLETLANLPHGGWDDPDASQWSPWHTTPGVLCDLETVDSCWQFRFGEIEPTEMRADIIRAERNVFVRTIGGCNRLGLSSTMNAGRRVPDRTQDKSELDENCVNVSQSQTRYRQKSFTYYALHFDLQQAPPRQNSNAVVFDATLDLISGSGTPLHTNQSTLTICGWPTLGEYAEVSVPLTLRSDLELPDPLSGVTSADPGCALSPIPPNTKIYPSSPLYISANAVSDAAASRCDQTIPASLLWMSDAREIAANLTNTLPSFTGVLPDGHPPVDLSTLNVADEYVIYGVGDVIAEGTLPTGVSLAIAAAGDIIVRPDSFGYFGVVAGSSGTVALVAGCDVYVEEPVGVVLLTSAENVHLERVAILAPSGGFYPAGYLIAADPLDVPTVELTGSIATGYWGQFGTTHAATGDQVSGYGFNIDYPPEWGLVELAWWPDPLGGSWEPLH